MFGYIVPQICELKVREYEVFRAYYCGLCKALKSEYKRSAVLNYDSVFLYLLSDSLRETGTMAQPCKCALHPMQGRTRIDSPASGYAADVNILMAYFKANDDVRDGGRGAKTARAFLKKAYRKASAKRPQVVRVAQETVERLLQLEEQRSPNTDAAADTYAQLLGRVFEDADVLQSHILYDLGYSLGRWVYLIDAAEDFEKDRQSGNYNVYLCKYGELSDPAREEIRRSLQFSLAQAAQELERLDIRRNRELVRNVIYLGLRAQTELVLSGRPRLTMQVGGANLPQ